MKMRKNGMTLIGVMVILALLCASILLFCYVSDRDRRKLFGQGPEKTLTANRYEAHYFPNRTVIKLKMEIGRKEGLLEEVLSDIKRKYEIEDVILRSAAPTDYLIIATPKKPNSPLP